MASPAGEPRIAILRDLAEFMGTTPPRDDITLVVIRGGLISLLFAGK